MSGIDDVPDSTDWLNTPLTGLAPLENGLRCQVCKDFFATPMITSCSHTFCSICIRRYLSQEGRCPACRESDQEMKLRRNWAVEELVAHFQQSRDTMLSFARQAVARKHTSISERSRKRRKVALGPDNSERRSTRSQSKRNAAAPQASQLSASTEEVPDSEDEGSVYGESPQAQPRAQINGKEPNDGLVACPSCGRRMRETAINLHLDRCLAGLATSPEPATLGQTRNGALPFTQQTKSTPTIVASNRLPSINYALFSEAKLRSKLKDLGIPNHGNKELMRKRHTEWMNLWNANCDSSKPRTKRDLLRELETWERTLGRQIERGATSASPGVMGKDFDRNAWAKSHTNDFDNLIKKAREKRVTVSEQDAPRSDDPAHVQTDATMEETVMEDVGEDRDCLHEDAADKIPQSSSLVDTGPNTNVVVEITPPAGTSTKSPGAADVSTFVPSPLAGNSAVSHEPLSNGTHTTNQKPESMVSLELGSSPADTSASYNFTADSVIDQNTPGKRSKFFD